MKTVKVRMPVLMFPDGEWISLAVPSGEYQKVFEVQARDMPELSGRLYWLTAELPVPEVEAEVSDAR
jgi:hypothetical protein